MKEKKYMEEFTKKYNFDDTRKKDDFNEYDVSINGLDKDGYNINDVDEDGLNKDGFNINSIKETRKKYPNRKVNWIYNDGFYYDQYGFDKKGLNKDGLNKYGYKQSSGKGLNISSLPIFLSKIYTNNSSKELINDIKQLVKNLYKNKQITKQVYNTLSSLELYK